MSRTTLVAIAVAILTITGCSGDRGADQASNDPATSSTPTTITSSTPTTIPLDGPGIIGDLSTMTRQSAGFLTRGQPTAQLVAIRQAPQEGFQRVVLEFSGDTAPQYRVGFEDKPARQPGSGTPVEVPGSVLLLIHAEPSSRVDMGKPNFPLTYDGPERLALQGPGPATDLVFVGDFEANMFWAVGLTRQAPFAVGVLSNPTRLVVDISTN
jgi:hypothetical protein